MARPKVTYEKAERGIRKVIRTYDDGRTVERWQVRLANPNGKVVVHGTYPTLRAARRALTKARKDVLDRNYSDPAKGRVSFKVVAEHWFEHTTGHKPSTRQRHRHLINGRLKPLHDEIMNRLDYDTLVRFQTSLAHLAPATQRQTMWIVRAICEDARKRKLIAVNPCLDLPKISKRKGAVSIPQPDEVERLLAHLARPTNDRPVDARWSLLAEAAAFSGLRAGELAGIKRADFNATKRALHVRRAIATGAKTEGAPKSDAGLRIVDDLDPGLCRRLAAYADEQELRPGDYLFGWKDAAGVSHPYNHANYYKRRFQPAAQSLGLDIRFHALRHFNASLLIDAGLSPVEVAARLGHSSAGFTLSIYAHLFKKESSGLGELIAQRRAEARGATGNVIPLPTAREA
jgi:integrase